jgi:hypothetical protein
VRLLLAFVIVVIVGAIWETSRGRSQRPLPLLAFSTFVAVSLFMFSRLM